jgi:hypothetical protein
MIEVAAEETILLGKLVWKAVVTPVEDCKKRIRRFVRRLNDRTTVTYPSRLSKALI